MSNWIPSEGEITHWPFSIKDQYNNLFHFKLFQLSYKASYNNSYTDISTL